MIISPYTAFRQTLLENPFKGPSIFGTLKVEGFEGDPKFNGDLRTRRYGDIKDEPLTHGIIRLCAMQTFTILGGRRWHTSEGGGFLFVAVPEVRNKRGGVTPLHYHYQARFPELSADTAPTFKAAIDEAWSKVRPRSLSVATTPYARFKRAETDSEVVWRYCHKWHDPLLPADNRVIIASFRAN